MACTDGIRPVGSVMKIDTEKLNHIFAKYNNEFECHYQSDLFLGGKKIRAGSEIMALHVIKLREAGVKEIDVVYDVTMYEYLTREFPGDYRKPVLWLDYYQVDRLLEELEKVNGQSRRKRFLTIIGDVYGRQTQALQKNIVMRHGDRLEYNKWKTMKMLIDSQQKFFCRNSEHGIILFVNLKSEGGQDYVSKFNRHAELTTAIVSRRKSGMMEISPDFIPSEDVYSVTIPGKLLEEYIQTGARLIIIGDELTKTHKEALLQVRDYDPFVRMMVAPPLDPQNLDHFLQQVKIVYNTDRWKKT